MNILHLLSQNQLTGAELYAVTLAQEQIKNGHRVFQISNGFYIETAAEKHCLEVECHKKPDFKKNCQWLSEFIKYNEIHVIHSHSRAAAKMATQTVKLIKGKQKVGHVATIHGRQHPSFSKRLFNHYGHLQIAVCDEVKKQLVKDFGYNETRIHVLPNPIDLNKFYWLESKKLSQRKKKINIAIIGRTTGPKKVRSEIILTKLHQLAKKNKIEITWTIIGGKADDLKFEMQDIKVTEKNIDHLTTAHLKEFDLIIGSGRVAIESLLTGIPVIAFGESCYEGLITKENYDKAQLTNFGDIQYRPKMLSIDSEQCKKDFEKIISGKISEAELHELSLKAKNEYEVKTICNKVQKIYECAVLLAIYPKWIPVLMYHKIPHQEIQSKHRIFVTKENFVKHLLYLQKNKFTTLTFQDLKDFSSGKKNSNLFPKKPIVLTFDDGYVDNLENASPLLKQLGFKAEIYLLADQNIASNNWDTEDPQEPLSPIISGPRRKEWLNSAFTIGSHGWRHKRITDMSLEEAKEELLTSKLALEKEFNQPVISYAYTYGDTNPAIAELAAEVGYEFAVNTDTGGLLLQENPYQIFRVNIFPEDSTSQLRKKTSSWYRKYYFWKRKK